MATIYCNAGLPSEQLERLAGELGGRGHRVLISGNQAASNLVEGGSDPLMLEAEVAFGQPSVSGLRGAGRMKFVQLNSAGYARYDTGEVRELLKGRGAVLATASGVYAEPCAQHVVAFMHAMVRRLPEAWAEQAGGRGWPVKELRGKSRLLKGETALLVGYGAIAERVAELLAPYGMKIKAVRRNVRGDERVATYPIVAVDELLPEADHVLNLLPGTPETAGFFGRRRLGGMKRGAFFYNIGRGTTVDQEALMGALSSGHLAGAYLDVTDPEPLPPEHGLWRAANCYITPHTAGGFVGEFDALADMFLENFSRWERGETLRHWVI